MRFNNFDRNNDCMLNIDVNMVVNRKYILENVKYKVVNHELNKEMLSDAPGKIVNDLIATYRVFINEDKQHKASYLVTNEILNKTRISFEELDQAAMKNTFEEGYLLQRLANMLGISEIGGPNLYVLSNRDTFNGASVILYKEYLDKAAKKLGGDFYIIPSSIHELIAVPVSICEPDALKAMINDVNSTIVDDSEILSYSVYVYRSSTGKVNIAA